jgi:hypothetical protein
MLSTNQIIVLVLAYVLAIFAIRKCTEQMEPQINRSSNELRK